MNSCKSHSVTLTDILFFFKKVTKITLPTIFSYLSDDNHHPSMYDVPLKLVYVINFIGNNTN